MSTELLDPIAFNTARDTQFTHRIDGFESVLHVFDLHWHGIRSATGCLPGHKLGISHKRLLDPTEKRHIEGLVVRHAITSICYQGYSPTADDMIGFVRGLFGDDVRQTVVTHVTSAQFEHQFEMQMLKRMIAQRRDGAVRRLGSVKQEFAAVVPEFEAEPLFNLPPALPKRLPGLRAQGSVLVPLENTWRKNLYSNLIAALGCTGVDTVLSIHTPSGLSDIHRTSRLKILGFQTPLNLLGYMAASAAVLNVSFAECQPMAQLESLAAGTACLTGPLGLEPFSSHPLSRLTEVDYPDNPAQIAQCLRTLLDLGRSDPAELDQMIADFLALRIAAGIESYRQFLEL